jgi:hypothetical protein
MIADQGIWTRNQCAEDKGQDRKDVSVKIKNKIVQNEETLKEGTVNHFSILIVIRDQSQ